MNGQPVALAALLLVLSALPAKGQEVADVERFQLFAECSPMDLFVEVQGVEAIGITEEHVETMAANRLLDSQVRGSGLYVSERVWHLLWGDAAGVLPVLEVHLVVLSNTFAWDLAFLKVVQDAASGMMGRAPTWRSAQTVRMSPISIMDADFIMQDLSEGLDAFILDYSRINGEYCR